MRQYTQVLRACPLFEGIDEGYLSRLLPCLRGKVLSAADGEVLFPAGAPAGSLGIVLSGQVRMGRESFGPGELFGAVYACGGASALPADVVAEGDCTVLRVDCRRAMTPCDHSCAFHLKLIRNLTRVLAGETLRLQRRLECIVQRTTRDKLLVYLRQQADEQGSASFTIPFDRQQLADYLGVERTAMSTELGKLRRAGVLECSKRQFTLLEREDA